MIFEEKWSKKPRDKPLKRLTAVSSGKYCFWSEEAEKVITSWIIG
jgi:hypothetical protein